MPKVRNEDSKTEITLRKALWKDVISIETFKTLVFAILGANEASTHISRQVLAEI